MNIYLAGPMRHKPNFNAFAFADAAAKLRAEHHTVFNPAERDVAEYGVVNSPAGSERTLAKAAGIDVMTLRRELFLADTQWICQYADAIYLLPGWEASKGATAERALGLALGLEIVEL